MSQVRCPSSRRFAGSELVDSLTKLYTCPLQDYLPRLVDTELDELLPDLAAIALDGAKGIGKTEICSRRARTGCDQ